MTLDRLRYRGLVLALCLLLSYSSRCAQGFTIEKVIARPPMLPRGGGGVNPLRRPSPERTQLSLATSSADNNPLQKLQSTLNKNFFLLGMGLAVALAKLAPAIGTNGSLPAQWIGRYGVAYIFLLSGLSLELEQLKQAVSNVQLNGLVQLITFVAWPLLVGWPLKQLGQGLLPVPILDGILMLTCLPTTINMCIILTTTAGGNVAAALSNTVLSNLLGIFATPALLFRFFGAQIELPFVEMLLKLCQKILLPVAVGQALRLTTMKAFYQRHSKKFKRSQELVLLTILWNAFCTAFTEGLGLSLRHGLILLTVLPAMHLSALALNFRLFSALSFDPPDVLAATFCASQKTLAFGLPLIQTLFGSSTHLAAYSAPLMFLHPLQLLLGSVWMAQKK